MIDVLLIDIDDTILDFHASEARAIRETLSACGIDPTDEVVALYSSINREEWERLERGETTRGRLVVHRFERLFAALGVEGDAVGTQACYEGNLVKQPIYLPGAREALERLAARYEVYLVTNGSKHIQERRIITADLATPVRDIFISEAIGTFKPLPEFFDHVFRVIGEEKRARTAIIGDSLSADMQGGYNAGIMTIWVNTRHHATPEGRCPDITVERLSEVEEILTTRAWEK